MQSPDGGLLNMDPPALRAYRRRINGLFTRRAAEAARPAIHALACHLAGSLRSRTAVDALTGFAEPFTAAAVCAAMSIPHLDWDRVLEFSRVAFAVVPSAAAVGEVATAWQDLYGYYEPIVAAKRARPDGTLTSQLAAALEGFTTGQIVRVVATVSNGFGAVLPVLATAIAELAGRPQTVAVALRGERAWTAVADGLLSYRTLFPIALPRVVLAGTWLGGRPLSKGTRLSPWDAYGCPGVYQESPE